MFITSEESLFIYYYVTINKHTQVASSPPPHPHSIGTTIYVGETSLLYWNYDVCEIKRELARYQLSRTLSLSLSLPR